MAKKDKDIKASVVDRKAKREKIFGSPVRNLLVLALVCALLGAAFILRPALVYSYCGYAIGGLIGLVGLVYIIMYFARKPVSGVFHSEFGIGLIALLAGAYVALGGYFGIKGGADIGFEMLVRIIGVLIALDGVLKLQYSLDVARMRFGGWWLLMLFSFLGIALGVFTFLGYTYDVGNVLAIGARADYTAAQNAFISGMMALGIAFCANALLDILGMIVILVRNRKANRAAVIAAGDAMVAEARQQEISLAAAAAAPAAFAGDAVVVPAPGNVPEPVVAEPVLATPPTAEN